MATTKPKRASATVAHATDRDQILRRLARIEGQVRGIARMVERDEVCTNILQQTSALRAAVDSVSIVLLEDHVASCMQTAVKSGDADASADDVMDVVRRSMGRPARARSASSDS